MAEWDRGGVLGTRKVHAVGGWLGVGRRESHTGDGHMTKSPHPGLAGSPAYPTSGFLLSHVSVFLINSQRFLILFLHPWCELCDAGPKSHTFCGTDVGREAATGHSKRHQMKCGRERALVRLGTGRILP